MTRDELRAADPEFAALADMLRSNGCDIRVSHYQFHDGRELGRKPEPDGTVQINLLKPTWLEASAAWAKANKNRLTGAK